MMYIAIGLILLLSSTTLSMNMSKSITPRFIVVNQTLNFSNAELYCQQQYGTHLATFYTMSDVLQAQSLCQTMGNGHDFWIGLNDIDTENEYVYTSGAVVYDSLIANYYPNEPFPSPFLNCITMSSDIQYQWNSWNCEDTSLYALCDASNTQTPTLQPPTSSPTVTPRFITVAQYMNFTAAESYCQQQYGTHLATIHTVSDIRESQSACNQIGNWPRCWIGLNSMDNNDEWVFTSGAYPTESAQDWYELETFWIEGNCIFVSSLWQYQWTKRPCDSINAFLCDSYTQNPTTQTSSPTTNEPTIPTASPSTSPTSLTPTSSPIFGCLTTENIVHETDKYININDQSVEIQLSVLHYFNCSIPCQVLKIDEESITFLSLFIDSQTQRYHIQIYDDYFMIPYVPWDFWDYYVYNEDVESHVLYISINLPNAFIQVDNDYPYIESYSLPRRYQMHIQ